MRADPVDVHAELRALEPRVIEGYERRFRYWLIRLSGGGTLALTSREALAFAEGARAAARPDVAALERIRDGDYSSGARNIAATALSSFEQGP